GKDVSMCRLKKIVLNLFFAGAIALPAGLYGQDNTGTSSSSFTPTQLDQAFARLDETPDDNVKTELEGVAETHAKDLQSKLGLDDAAYSDIKDAINDYLEKGWTDRVELAREAGDPTAYQDKSADLAYLRVDLAEQIKDEIGDGSESKWNSNAVGFWTSLDQADFHVKAKEAGIATSSLGENPEMMNQNNMNQDQMNMNNDQQNMNEEQQNIEQNQENTDEGQSSTDQNMTDEDQSTPSQDQSTDENQNNPDQGQ
ncbi:MAG TPA: hypothetical protein VLM39_06945, partial [Ignavibacteriaceae bacterium]|nr:hypothetical protein [Ignavibacteriaceae bacterium]